MVEKIDAETEKLLLVSVKINPHLRADKLIERHKYNFSVKSVEKEPPVAKSPFGKQKSSVKVFCEYC